MAEEHRAWASELSELEYERLKSFEYSGRLNEILIEGFDFWTDLGLIAVLFVFSSENVDVQYEDPIIGVLTATTFTQCQTGDAAPDRDRSLFRALFVAALVLQVVNVIVRACIAVGKLCYKETIDGIKKAALYIAGVIFVIVSPHNGLFFIDTVFQRSTDAEGVIEFTQREILLDVLLIGLEDLPQFVIQVIFFRSVTTGDVPIAFWLSTIVTVLSLLISIGAIAVNFLKLRGLRRRAGLDPKVEDKVSP